MSYRTLTALWSAIVMFAILEFKQVHDTDIFWQVKLGQIMLQEGRLPLADRFTFTHAGQSSPPVGWLAQLFFATLYDKGGWHLARAAHHFALVGSLLFAAATCRRHATSALGVAVAIGIGFVVNLSNADLRPQSLGLLGFAALLAVARSQLSFGRKVSIVAPLVIAWQNMHPSVVVGATAVAGLAAADFLDPPRPGRGRWEMAVLTLITAAAQFATPIGVGILDVARSNLRISRDVMRLEEWVPPWDPKVIEAVDVYWVVLLGSVGALIRLRGRISMRDRCLLIVMTAMSLYAARFIIFWAVALVPFWAQAAERAFPIGMFAWARRPNARSARPAWSIIAVAAGLGIVIAAHPARFRPIVNNEIPLDGVSVLREQLPGPARIYNDYFWAGPLLLDGAPGWRVAVDGRLYFFADPTEWRAIDDASAGRISLDELENRHRPDAFFLFPPRNQPLIRELSMSPRWRVCYHGPTCAAYVKTR